MNSPQWAIRIKLETGTRLIFDFKLVLFNLWKFWIFFSILINYRKTQIRFSPLWCEWTCGGVLRNWPAYAGSIECCHCNNNCPYIAGVIPPPGGSPRGITPGLCSPPGGMNMGGTPRGSLLISVKNKYISSENSEVLITSWKTSTRMMLMTIK